MQATTPARHIHTLARTHMRLSHHASLPPFRAQSNRKSTHANADTQQTKARHRHTGNQLRSNIQIKLQMQLSRPSTPARLCLTRVANLLRIARLTLFCFSQHLYGAWGSLVVTRMQVFLSAATLSLSRSVHRCSGTQYVVAIYRLPISFSCDYFGRSFTSSGFQGYVHWPESLGWNIPDRRDGRREGLCDCSQEQEGGVEQRGLAGWSGVGRLEGVSDENSSLNTSVLPPQQLTPLLPLPPHPK